MPPRIILIVEDEKILLKALVNKFGYEEGFNVITAEDGEKGLSIALEKHPSLILLDILMPKMDGITMAKKLRKNSWGATVPIIFLSNVNPDGKTLSKIIASDAVYYFMKCQWDLTDIVNKVREILGESKI